MGEERDHSYIEMAYDKSNHKTGENYYDIAGNVVSLDGKNMWASSTSMMRMEN